MVFDADSRLCLSYVQTLGPKRNLDHRSFFSLDQYVNEFIQIISFFKISSFKLRCETFIKIVLFCCHQVAYFTMWVKLTVAFTCTSLSLNLYTSVFRCGCGFGFEQKIWWINGFSKKRYRLVDLRTPIHPPPVFSVSFVIHQSDYICFGFTRLN